MAEVTLDRLAAGIRAANAKGDVETVKKLGAAYRQMQGGAGPIALAGKVEPAGSTGDRSANVEMSAQEKYDFATKRVRDQYFPGATDEQWAKIAGEHFAPYDLGKLLNAGLTFGFNDEAAGAGQAVGEATRGHDIGEAFTLYTDLERARQDLGAEQQGGLGLAAEIGGSLLAGRPDMAAGKVAGLLPTIVDGAKGGAAAGGLYGFGSADGDIQNRLVNAGWGTIGGATVGAAVPAGIAGAKKVISPVAAQPAKAAAADFLRNEGVELTAGQATGNRGLQFREAELGGNAARDFMERQGEQFTAAALKRGGMNAPRATHDVLQTASDDIGNMFETLASRNDIVPDQRMAREIQVAWRRFEGSTNPSTRPKVIERMIADIYGKPRGPVSGAWYKSTRSELGRLSKSQNPELAEAARDLQFALDGAMERSIAAANPTDLGAWRDARRLYRNYLVIEDAATRAGAASADGLITPAALRSAAIKAGKRAYARGRSDFAGLADAGVSAMTPLPDSGTAGRLGAKMFVPAGAATGATVGGMAAGPLGAGVGAAVGAAVPWAAGRAMLSGPGRAYLGNQLAAAPVDDLAALLGSTVARGVQPLLPR